MGFSSFGGSTNRLNPGAAIAVGSAGLGLSTAGFGAVDHRPENAFGSNLNMYQDKGQTEAGAILSGSFGGSLRFGNGSLGKNGFNEGWTLQMGIWAGPGFTVGPDSTGAMFDSGGVSALCGGKVYLTGPPRNGVNGRGGVGDAINNDTANGSGGSFFNGFEVSQIGTINGHGTRGSMHQFLGGLAVNEPAGESDIYCEGLNCFMFMHGNRRGALLANWESDMTINNGFPARAVGVRAIIREENVSANYSAAVFGASSPWLTTGTRALEAHGAGSQRPGTGLAILGTQGFNYGILQLDGSNAIISGLDGAGGFFTRTKAGAPVDADFRQPRSGLLAVDTANSKLYVRVGSTWKSVTVA